MVAERKKLISSPADISFKLTHTAVMIHHHPSPNHEPRRDGPAVNLLVLHYTGMKSAREALERLCDPDAKVSAHYLIDEDGTVYRLVPESERAWHAGVASWRGETDINSRSIGIELVNPGHEFGYRPFPEPQMLSLIDLALDICERQAILPCHVLGHSDIAPERKQDPGELFAWKRLAAEGVGLWPDTPLPAPTEELPALLAEYGYGGEEKARITAFQRHFRPLKVNGIADEECAGLAKRLLEMAKK